MTKTKNNGKCFGSTSKKKNLDISSVFLNVIDGAEGLSNLLRSKYDGRIRITTRAAIITALIAHFTENV